jgi:hypothetical protein
MYSTVAQDGAMDEAERQRRTKNMLLQVGDGFCNEGPWNTRECGFDGGDCCVQSCQEPNKDMLELGLISYTPSRRICTASNCLDPSPLLEGLYGVNTLP